MTTLVVITQSRQSANVTIGKSSVAAIVGVATARVSATLVTGITTEPAPVGDFSAQDFSATDFKTT